MFVVEYGIIKAVSYRLNDFLYRQRRSVYHAVYSGILYRGSAGHADACLHVFPETEETSLSTVLGIGKKALVEGVETEEMKQLLVKNRSNYLQGYLFSRPLPEEDFIQFIRKHEK